MAKSNVTMSRTKLDEAKAIDVALRKTKALLKLLCDAKKKMKP